MLDSVVVLVVDDDDDVDFVSVLVLVVVDDDDDDDTTVILDISNVGYNSVIEFIITPNPIPTYPIVGLTCIISMEEDALFTAGMKSNTYHDQ